MKIRADFVTNSSSSSFVSVHVENPVLFEILADWREAMEEYGFEFLENEEGKVTGVKFEEEDDILFLEGFSEDIKNFASEFVMQLGDALGFETGDDFSSDEMCQEIEKWQDEIEKNYAKIDIARNDSGWEGDGGDAAGLQISKALKWHKFHQYNKTDPQFDSEVRKWELILKFECSRPDLIIDFFHEDIVKAVELGDPHAMTNNSWHSNDKYSFKAGDASLIHIQDADGELRYSDDEYKEYKAAVKSDLIQKAVASEGLDIERTAYADRIERIEHINVDDKVILKANYNDPYRPVAIEVSNLEGGTLGYLRESYGERISLGDLAQIIDEVEAYVQSVTPLSKRRKNAKYALMSIRLTKKKRK